MALAERIRPFTERAMKIEVAPWIQDYVVDMEELYTELALEKVHCSLQEEETNIVDDYRELFDKCAAKRSISNTNLSTPEDEWEDNYNFQYDLRNSSGEDSKCLCFGKSISRQIQRAKKKTKFSKKRKGNSFVSEMLPETDVKTRQMKIKSKKAPLKVVSTQSDTGEKILAKGDPGMGKTTWSKKVAWDWAKGLFQTFSLVFFVFLKLVKPGSTIENIIIEQNLYMKGLKISDKRLENIIETFGNRCLLILDGLDEHALGMNRDVLRIIRGERHLSCNILVSSRPHSTKQIEKYFPVILRVEGFTYNKAEQFASKILSDKKSIEAVLSFNPQDFSNDVPIHKCPILLSFLCLLVREDALDLSTTGMHVGEIYLRMVRCLYKKFTIRKGIPFEISEFNKITMLIGKLAYDTLLSGNPLLRKSRVLAEVGPDAFDYGLLIGHEDAHRLIKDETADIYITFPHRSILEFLGAFFFVWSANERVEFVTTTDTPIFLTNTLFLQFCLWFLKSDDKHKNFKNASRVYDYLTDECATVINHPHFDTRQIAKTYPALGISSALETNDKLRLNLFRDILAKCDEVNHITVESLSSDVSTRLKGLEINDPSTPLHLENPSKPLSEQCVADITKCRYHKKDFLKCLTPLNISECVGIEGNLDCLFQSLLLQVPQLTHLNLLVTDLTAGNLRALCLACNGEKKTLPNVTSLCLSLPLDMRTNAVSNNLFALPWPYLKEFYLYTHATRVTDMEDSLYLALKENKLPNLSCLGVQHDMTAVNIRPISTMHKLEYLLLRNCVLTDEFQDTAINLSRLDLLSCKNVNRYLSKLLHQCPLSLGSLPESLVLNDCSLDSSDLAYLAQASAELRLSNLKHLNLCHSGLTRSALIGLFCSFNSWKHLITLDIRSNLFDIIDLALFMTLDRTERGFLGCLEELGIDSCPLVDTVWSCLKALYLSSCKMNSLANILDAVDRGRFPALRKICVTKFTACDPIVVNALNEININCHETKEPFYDPFTRIKCICQNKPMEEDS